MQVQWTDSHWFTLKANHCEPNSLSWHFPDRMRDQAHLEPGHWQSLGANQPVTVPTEEGLRPPLWPAARCTCRSTTAVLQVAKCTCPPGLYQLNQGDAQLFVKYMQERDCVLLCKMYRESNLNLYYSSSAVDLIGFTQHNKYCLIIFYNNYYKFKRFLAPPLMFKCPSLHKSIRSHHYKQTPYSL